MSMTVVDDITADVLDELGTLGINIQFSEITSKEKMDRFLENDLMSHIKYFSSTKINIHQYILDNQIQVRSFGDEVFADIQGLCSIRVPESVVEMSERTFTGCDELQDVYLQNAALANVSNAPWGIPEDAYLHVPSASFSYFRNNTCWDNYRLVDSDSIDLRLGEECTTFCFSRSCDFSQVKGVKAYVASGYDETTGMVELTQVDKLPAGQGAVLRAEPGFYRIPFVDEAENVGVNMLVGTTENVEVSVTDGSATNCILQINEQGVPDFCPIDGKMTFSTGKAYLSLPSSAR